VAELAQKMAVKATEVIKSLMNMGVMATINQPIDQDTAVLWVEEMVTPPRCSRRTRSSRPAGRAGRGGGAPRPPSSPSWVTSITQDLALDYIRRTKVAAGEAGGITQHIGAYHVETPKGVITSSIPPVTPRYAMRARGAKAPTSCVVVAADDGVMPQTIEAIQHARAANVPIVVAVNKVDKSDATPTRAHRAVQARGHCEEWGGQNMFVSVSARTGAGVDKLLEAILLAGGSAGAQRAAQRARFRGVSNRAWKKAAAP